VSENGVPAVQDAVIHWKVTGPEADPDHWEVALEGRTCSVTDKPASDLRVAPAS
jgi:hypothetical protein